MLEIKKLSNDLHRVFFDENALERKCVPNQKILTSVVNTMTSIKPEIKIRDFTKEYFLLIIKSIANLQKENIDSSILGNEEINLIFDTFIEVIKVNNRLDDKFDKDDVAVLCMLYNIIYIRKNKHGYIDRMNSWRI